ncbi:MAG: hypothetical protein JST41_08790 [Bacteroidetes bacterium]|nr:hypothetical protein [Bacteroidota bacterium]MBX7128984.1 hypothetical protein [Flavobacteriales bacterium]MCC6655502.1 hypothetical protein [Flavobacteriales bacterium]HMU12687.1 hypothetical protein [Flavobacteriales bacterium]HMW97041.1 hypothetical protein [Flavobacteriales bacterium]
MTTSTVVHARIRGVTTERPGPLEWATSPKNGVGKARFALNSTYDVRECRTIPAGAQATARTVE